MWIVRVGIALGLAAAFGAGPAAGEPRERCGLAWEALQGSVSPGGRCNAVVVSGVATDLPGGGRARARYLGPVAGRGTIAVTVQRLTGDGGSVQVEVPGGFLVLADGMVGFYTSEAAWAADGFRPLPPPLAGARLIEPRRVELDLGRWTVTARIDGTEVGRWTVATTPERGDLAVWVTARQGHRPRVRVSDWRVPRP